MRATLFVPVGVVLAALASGCSSEAMSPIVGGDGVTVGNILFRSNHNATANPAVDTVAAGTTLEWKWVGTGGVSHSIRSVGSPSFTSSAIMSGSGTTYSIDFTTPGLYTYDCAVHGAAMTGRVVVQ